LRSSMAMNDAEVERQIDQMVRFIKQEAQEKSNEIGVSAEEEFNIEKLQLLEAEKGKIRKDFERREGQIDVKKKIEYSKQLNASRIKVLQAQEDAVQGVLREARDALRNISSDKKKYPALLTDILVQSFAKLQQPAVRVRSREVDAQLVQSIIEPARQKFSQVYGGDAPAVEVDTKDFLPGPPSGKDDDEMASCTGGVSVSSANGKIVCNNTLDDRLQIAFAANLPEFRTALFGETAC